MANGSVAIDIGANIGCHTSMLASLVGETGRVIAYEPQPLLAQILRLNTASKPADVVVRPVAVGATRGTVSVMLPDYGSAENPGGWSLRLVSVVL